MSDSRIDSEMTFEEFEARKRADRAALNQLPADKAQAEVEGILFPRLWQAADPQELAWPGDLADDPDDAE